MNAHLQPYDDPMVGRPSRATQRRRCRRLGLLVALLATFVGEEGPRAEPRAAGEGFGPLLAQARASRQRQRTNAARRRLERRRRRRRPAPKPRPQAVEVSPPPKQAEKTAWGVDLGLGVQRLHVLYTSDIFGRFAWPGCQTRPRDKAEMGHLVASVAERTKQIRDEGGGVPLVVAAGSMTRPDVLGNFVFKDATLAPVAVELIRRVGFDAVGVGMFDFGVKPTAFRRYLTLMRNAKVPLLASNVACRNRSDFPCSHLGGRNTRYVIVERGGLKIGVFGVVREDLVKRILTRSGKGITVEDVTESARATIAVLRNKEKVDFIVALAAVNVEADTPLPSLEFVRRLGADAPEVIIADTMFERGLGNYMAQIRRSSGPVILGTDRFGQTMGEAIIYYRRDKGRVYVDHIGVHKHRAVDAKAAAEDAQRSKQLLDGMCRVLDRTIDGAQFAKPMSYSSFMRYALDIMRRNTKAEIALLNESAVADTTFPMSGKLTEEKLLRAIRTETKVGTVWITGDRLKELLGTHLDSDDPSLFIAGVTHKDGDWEVNGRALLSSYEYRVATTAFVASGGDLLVDLDEEFRPTKTTLRRMVIDFFKSGGARLDGDPAIDAESDFTNLGREWLLSTNFSLSVGVDNVSISNGDHNDRYFRPPLWRDRLVSLNIDARLEFIAESQHHIFEALATAIYSKDWLAWFSWDDTIHRPVEATDQVETLDELRIILGYRSRYLRGLVGFNRWWAPEPFIQGVFITEFTPSGMYAVTHPDGSITDHEYYYMEMIGTVGFGLVLHPMFFPKLGFAYRGELLTPTDARVNHGTSSAGLYTGYNLRRIQVISSPSHPVELESRGDFYFTDLGNRNRIELAAESKLSFGITRVLRFSLTHRFYLIDIHREDISVANDIIASLGVNFDYRRQTFGR